MSLEELGLTSDFADEIKLLKGDARELSIDFGFLGATTFSA